MKDSGIEWIGEIPDDWEMVLLSSIFHQHKEKNSRLQETNLLSLSYGKIITKDIETREGLLPASFDTYNIIDNGDIVFRLTDLQNDQRSLRTGLCTQKGIITSAYITLRKNVYLESRYMHYLFHSYDICKVFYGMGDGVRQGMGFDDLKKLLVLFPSLQKQQQIADFLDKKCAEIDRLIAHEETMIDELKAYKQSVITEAVTKGLDRTAPMKNSGVEWIGEIPEHWLIMPLKSKFNFGKGLSITKADLVSEGIKVISYGQIHAKYNKSHCINKSLYRFVDSQYLQICPSALVRRGDFIFADTSEDIEGSGDFVYIDNSDLIFAGYHCITLKNKNLHDGKYLAFLFMSQNWKNQIQSQVNGVKLFSITKRYLADAKLLLPPQNEQQQIADYLDKKCAEIDRLISLKQEKIAGLREYKKSLIYEYVTGKKEVV